MKSLREIFHKFDLKNDATMRVLFLYLIGSVIVPFSNNVVHLIYLKILEDIDRIKDFVWEAAMLAFVQISLRKVKLEETHSQGGHFYFLSIRMWYSLFMVIVYFFLISCLN